MDKEELNKHLISESIKYTFHASQRMAERGIKIKDVLKTISKGLMIEDYPNDSRGASCLFFNGDKRNPLHVHFSVTIECIVIITTYIPDTEDWENDFMTRKRS